LAEPAKPALPKGVVEAKPKSTAVPAWGAKVPAIGVKPLIQEPAKPVTKVTAPLKKSDKLLEPGSVVKKSPIPASAPIVGKPAPSAAAAGVKGSGAIMKPDKLITPLDILGDVFFGGGEKTMGLLGHALLGGNTGKLNLTNPFSGTRAAGTTTQASNSSTSSARNESNHLGYNDWTTTKSGTTYSPSMRDAHTSQRSLLSE
jgi:hypothetical protein